MRKSFGKRAPAMLILAALVMLAACTAKTAPPATTATAPPPTTSAAGGPPVTISLVAQAMAFDKKTITVPAGASVTMEFNNNDTVSHNFALFTNSNATAPALFRGQVITGTSTVAYKFTAPTTPGTYFFRCDIHPASMTGSFVVTP
jgi:plastocyanin